MTRIATMLALLLLAATSAHAQDLQAFATIYLGTTGCVLTSGSGTPEGAVSAPCGSFWRTDTKELYVKSSGTGNTGWSLIPRVDKINTFTVDQVIAGSLNVQGALQLGSSVDAVIQRVAADTIEQRRGTNAQRLNVCNTWTSSTNFECASAWWNSNTFRLGTYKGSGGGSTRNMQFEIDGSTVLSFSGVSNATFSGQVNAPALALTTTPLNPIYGGTGLTSFTVGGVFYAPGATSMATLTPVAVGQVLTSTGLLSSPAWSGTPTLASMTSTNYVSRSAGWIIDAGGNLEVNTIWTKELHALSFTAENEKVFDGSALILPSQAVLSEAFTVPSLGASNGNLRVEYKQGSTAAVFTYGDSVVVRTFLRSGGALIVDDAIGTVAGPTISYSSLTSSGTTATWTSSSPHLQASGNVVVITGATQANYNGTFTITVTDSTHFTYTMGGTATSPATGSPVAVSKQPDTSNATYQQWAFTRGGTTSTGGSMASSTVVPTKTVVLDYGVTGNGFVRIDAMAATQVLSSLTSSGTTATATTASAHGFLTNDVVVVSGAAQSPYNGSFVITKTGATTFTYVMATTTSTPATGTPVVAGGYALNAPNIDVSTWGSTAPTYANTTVRTRLGALRGITGAVEYGLFAGDFANKHYVRFSDQNAEIAGIALRLYDGSTETIRLDPAVPSIALGSTLPSAYGTGTGIWMGKDSSVYKFRVGNPSGDRLQWDNTNLTIVSSNLTINSSGVYITPNSGASAAATKVYGFTDANGQMYYGGAIDGSGNQLMVIQNSYSGAGSVTANTFLYADGGGGHATTIDMYATASTTTTLMRLTADGFIELSTPTVYLTNASGNFQVRSNGLNNGTATITTVQPGFIGTSSAHNLEILAGNATKIKCFNGGGCTMGTPTGGDKGAGTLNATAVYDDNVLLTDWVFDLAYDQRRAPAAADTWPPSKRRLYTLAEVRDVTQRDKHLPWMPSADEFEQARGVGSMITHLYQGQEQQQLYLFELEARIAALEKKGGQ